MLRLGVEVQTERCRLTTPLDHHIDPMEDHQHPNMDHLIDRMEEPAWLTEKVVEVTSFIEKEALVKEVLHPFVDHITVRKSCLEVTVLALTYHLHPDLPFDPNPMVGFVEVIPVVAFEKEEEGPMVHITGSLLVIPLAMGLRVDVTFGKELHPFEEEVVTMTIAVLRHILLVG